MKKQKTTTRTLRFSEDLNKILDRDSKDKGVSTNSLISSILTKYAEWDRYTEKVGFISLPRDGFKLIINSVDEQEIKKLAEEVGSRQPQELLMFWFKKKTLDAILEGLSLYCRYGGITKYEIETSGEEYIIALYHEINKKWSIFLGYLITQGMKDMLDIMPKFEVTEYQSFSGSQSRIQIQTCLRLFLDLIIWSTTVSRRDKTFQLILSPLISSNR